MHYIAENFICYTQGLNKARELIWEFTSIPEIEMVQVLRWAGNTTAPPDFGIFERLL